jgi:hypothetical protein
MVPTTFCSQRASMEKLPFISSSNNLDRAALTYFVPKNTPQRRFQSFFHEKSS